MFSQKYTLCWQQNFQQYNTVSQVLKNEKAQFKVALRRYLNTHSFYPVYKIFIVFCSVLILYTLHAWYILYVYDLLHNLLSFWQTMGPWNEWMNE